MPLSDVFPFGRRPPTISLGVHRSLLASLESALWISLRIYPSSLALVLSDKRQRRKATLFLFSQQGSRPPWVLFLGAERPGACGSAQQITSRARTPVSAYFCLCILGGTQAGLPFLCLGCRRPARPLFCTLLLVGP